MCGPTQPNLRQTLYHSGSAHRDEVGTNQPSPVCRPSTQVLEMLFNKASNIWAKTWPLVCMGCPQKEKRCKPWRATTNKHSQPTGSGHHGVVLVLEGESSLPLEAQMQQRCTRKHGLTRDKDGQLCHGSRNSQIGKKHQEVDEYGKKTHKIQGLERWGLHLVSPFQQAIFWPLLLPSLWLWQHLCYPQEILMHSFVHSAPPTASVPPPLLLSFCLAQPHPRAPTVSSHAYSSLLAVCPAVRA